MRDGYLWFYLKNIGLPFLLLIFSLFERDRKHRHIFAGAFAIFIVAELIIFQPNEYDNNKLFYVWFALCAVPVSEYAFRLYDKLKGIRARSLLAALCCLMFFLSGSLSLAREAASDYQAFSRQAVLAAAYAQEQTPQTERLPHLDAAPEPRQRPGRAQHRLRTQDCGCTTTALTRTPGKMRSGPFTKTRVNSWRC